MLKYIVGLYIVAVLLISGFATSTFSKMRSQPEKNFQNNTLDYELFRIKSASNKMFVAQNKKFEVVPPPIQNNFRFCNLKA